MAQQTGTGKTWTGEAKHTPELLAALKTYEPEVVVEESNGRLTATGAAMKQHAAGRWVRLEDVCAALSSDSCDAGNLLPVEVTEALDHHCLMWARTEMEGEPRVDARQALETAIRAAIAKAQGVAA